MDRADAADQSWLTRAAHRRLRATRHDELFAASEIATGKVIGVVQPWHLHQELLRFPKQVARAYPDGESGRELHLVMDNYAAHKRVAMRDWLAANPRV